MDVRFESLSNVLPAIRDRATALDRSGGWPADDLAELGAIGAWRWFVPVEFGGEAIEPLELHLRYEAIASSSLATALVLSQRDSAVGLLAETPGSRLAAELLPRMASGEWFTTIGIAQLTTSRQGGAPALLARPSEKGYRLEGTIPWATAAGKANFIIAGAATEDGKQILFALPMDLPGIVVNVPLPLVALRASWTTTVECRDVELDSRWVFSGPMEKVLSGRSKSVPIGQAFLAFGLCRGGLNLISQHDSDRGRTLLAKMEEQLRTLREEVIAECQPGKTPDSAAQARLRGACNDLAVRITLSAVALYKGSALLADHPAQRLAREAMFLLVWSCPDPVIDCTVNALANGSL